MSDKPKPGKDKDLRYIRQAIEDADALFELLGSDLGHGGAPRSAELVAEAMLTVIEQMDLLDQMLGEPATQPTTVIDYNRKLRDLIREFLANDLPAAMRPKVARMAQAAGNQLRSLLIVKEIRRAN
jgi:hypothetical protein